jgi:hypothetical protein
MPFNSRRKKISQFTKGTALNDSTFYSTVQNGINKTFTQSQLIDDFADVYGASLRTYESESALIADDIAIGEYAIVEENNYSLYKITSDAATAPNIGLTSGFTATFESQFVTSVSDYTGLRALKPTGSISIMVGYRTSENDGGGGQFRWDSSDLSTEVTADTQSGIYVAPNSDATGTSGAWVRVYEGAVNVRWFGPGGTVSTDSAAAQAAVDTGSRMVFFDPAINYLLNDITIQSNVTLFSSDEGVTLFADTKISTDHGDPVSKNIFNADLETRITFKNLIFDGSISTFRTSNVPFTELESPVEITNSSFIVYNNCRFQNTLCQAATDGTRNQNGKRGVIYNVGVTNLLIEHCEIADSCYIEGFINYDCNNVTVQNNFTKQERSSFRISSPCVVTGLNTENVLISDNTWIGYGGSGINLVVRRNLKVVNNFLNGRGPDISNEASYTFTEQMRDILVQGNTFDFTDQSPAVSGYPNGNVTTGINVSGDPTFKFKDIRILDNAVTSMQRNILVEECENVTVRGNTVINAWGNTANYGRNIAVNNCEDIEISDNRINGLTSSEFGAGTHNIFFGGNTGTVKVLNNRMFEVTTYHIYVDSDNERVFIQENDFNHSATTPSRNVFSASDGCTGLIHKNNIYPFISGTPNSVFFNSAFSGGKFASFEYTDILEIDDDEAYQLALPIDYMIFEMGSDNQNYVAIMNKDGGSLITIFLSSNITKTTGALNGTTGTDTELTLSVSSSSVYIENRTGATVHIKVQIR